MKRVIILLLVVLLTACQDNSYEQWDDVKFGDYNLYYKQNGICDEYFHSSIYEDDESKYYLGASGCGEGDYYFINYNKNYITVNEAIEKGIITIDNVINSGINHLIIEQK